jgi:VIT1/CCC1 family predicted Fe2+/Mn2+ transporter
MMKKSTAVGVLFGALVIVVATLFFEAALLGLILSWFNVYLNIWQNFAIVVLANMIFKNYGGSSK